MRKTINIICILLLIWAMVDLFSTRSVILSFLLVGQLPGSSTTVSPTMMLAILTAISSVIIFQFLARRIGVIFRIRQHLRKFIERRERLPRSRYSHI